MKIQALNTQNFKGYDAAPIKNLYMGTIEQPCDVDIFNDLKDIANRENIGLYSVTGDEIFNYPPDEDWCGSYWDFWNQDCMLFLKGKNSTEVCASQYWGLPKDLNKKFKEKGIKENKEQFDVEGGNLFIGQKENGERYILAGIDSTLGAKKIANNNEIKEENVFIIPQSAYHIDMDIRPIGYPYVLVNDEDIVEKNIKSLNIPEEKKEKLIEISKRAKEKSRRSAEPISGKEIAKILEKQGFKPILIGGSYFYDTNFMNAIVHKKDDESLVYITNSAQNQGKEKEALQEIFIKELTSKVPNIANIDFIAGKNAKKEGSNHVADALLMYHGGIHCMCAEEPNFEIWG